MAVIVAVVVMVAVLVVVISGVISIGLVTFRSRVRILLRAICKQP